MVTTQDGKFPLNQLGQISMKSPQLIMVNMSSFPEVRRSRTDKRSDTAEHTRVRALPAGNRLSHTGKPTVTKSFIKIIQRTDR